MDEKGEAKSTQAYIVLGQIIMEPDPKVPEPKISEVEEIRALDYFSDTDRFEEDFLPWPKT